jgi:U1 small nuclear ribonucleoprotein A
MALLERKDMADVNNNINNNSSTGTEVSSNMTIYINNLNEKIKIDGNARIPFSLSLFFY